MSKGNKYIDFADVAKIAQEVKPSKRTNPNNDRCKINAYVSDLPQDFQTFYKANRVTYKCGTTTYKVPITGADRFFYLYENENISFKKPEIPVGSDIPEHTLIVVAMNFHNEIEGDDNYSTENALDDAKIFKLSTGGITNIVKEGSHMKLQKGWRDQLSATTSHDKLARFYYKVGANYGFKLNLHSLEEVTDLKKIKVYKGIKSGTEIVWDEGTIYNDGDTFYINSDEYIKWYPVDCTLGEHVLTAKFGGNDSKMFDYDGTKFQSIQWMTNEESQYNPPVVFMYKQPISETETVTYPSGTIFDFELTTPPNEMKELTTE